MVDEMDMLINSLEKIHDESSFAEIRKELRNNKEKLVMTNGCFDLLHIAHIYNLQESRSLGTKLIICVNTDESVKKYKGEDRPIQKLNERLYMLSSLSCVDFLIPFEEDNICRIVQRIKPDIYTKGSDYNIDTINQSERVIMEGLDVSIKFIDNDSFRHISTTSKISKGLV